MKWLTAAAVVLAIALLLPPSVLNGLDDVFSPGKDDVVNVRVRGHEPTRSEIRQLVKSLKVDDRQRSPGYERECGSSAGCVFGPAWSDDTTAPWGHDGCDTRNQMLAASLKDVRFRAGTDDCVVVSGTMVDPFTGNQLEFRKEQAADVTVDHLYPLALSWDQGAADWSAGRRARFANDPLNLLVVSGPANSSKGDSGPGEWLPLNAAYRCTYVGRYLSVAKEYELAITPADRAAALAALPKCPKK